MTIRNVPVDLGDGEEVVTVTVKGCACAADDLQMALVAFARDWAREHKKNRIRKESAATDGRPCGCQEKK